MNYEENTHVNEKEWMDTENERTGIEDTYNRSTARTNQPEGHTSGPDLGPGCPAGKKEKRKKGTKRPIHALTFLLAFMLSCGVGAFAGYSVTSQISGNGTGTALTNEDTASSDVASANDTSSSASAGDTGDADSDSSVLASDTKSTASESDTGDGSVVYVVNKSAESVVVISTEYKQVNSFARELVTEGAGSGVILSEDGYIVTNYHVIEDAQTITVTDTAGKEYNAEVIGADEESDLAVLKIDASGLKAVTFADSDEIRTGQMAVAIGNPLGELGGTVTEGIISAKSREVTIDGQTMNLIQTSAAVNAGNSGGGLFNEDGNLVGIVNAKTSGSDIEGLAFAIPSNTVSEVANELIENGYVSGRPQLGISVTEYSAQMGGMGRQSAGQAASGVYISEADSGTNLASGDLIVSIDGTEITSAADITSVIGTHEVGDVVEVIVERNGEQTTVKVTLTEKQPASDTDTASTVET